MNISQSSIACFLSAARTGSFSETAKELYLTRQAVSKNIQEMEKEVGYPLFHRHQSPLVLTKAGAKLYDYYFGFDYDLSGARRIFGRDVLSGPHLRLGWGTWIKPGSALLDSLNLFSAKKNVYMGVVQDQEKKLLDHLRTGEADAVLFSRYMASFIQEPYTAVTIAETPMRLGIASGHPLLKQGSLEQIVRRLPYLACWAGEEDEQEVIGRVSRELLSFQAMPPKIEIQPNAETVFLQVMLGNGFSCSPDAHLYGYGVETVVLERTVSLCLVWLNRNVNPSIRVLQEWLQGEGCEP